MADPLQEPALPTPSGIVSQFPTTYSNEQLWFYVAAPLCAVVPGILLLLRLYTKMCIVRNVDLIDCSLPQFRVIVSARFLLTVVYRSCLVILCKLASGTHK